VVNPTDLAHNRWFVRSTDLRNSLLLRELGEAAVRRGIRRFNALMLADNTPVLAVLRASGLTFTCQVESGTSELLMWLDGQESPTSR
jgi:hypothetical protein